MCECEHVCVCAHDCTAVSSEPRTFSEAKLVFNKYALIVKKEYQY